MFAKFIPKNIQQKLRAKERALDWQVSNSVLDSKLDGDIRPKDIASRSVFVRMCSNKSDVPNILISGGEVGPDGEVQFGGNAYKDYSGGDKVRPIAGIKDIQVEYKGGYKALREATINWTIFALQDLDRLTPYFLTVGKTVVLDWGWSYSRKQTFKQQLGVSPFITKNENNQFEVNQEIFSNPQEVVQGAGGDYDAIGGQITNFEYNLREDGGFDCVTKIVSLGVNLFQLPLDAGGNSASSVETNAGKKLYIPKDGLINAIVNLRDIIVYDVFKIPYETLVATTGGADSQFLSGTTYAFAKHLPDSLDAISEDIKKWRKKYAIHLPKENTKFAIAVDSTDSVPNVMWTKRDGNEEIFVTWGWMEDQLINRYISFTGGDDADSKLTIRSLDTVLHKGPDKEGQPITREEYDSAILPPSVITDNEIFEKYGVRDIRFSGEGGDFLSHPTPVLKKPTTIKNYPLLWPKEISKFFMLGSNFPPLGTSTGLNYNEKQFYIDFGILGSAGTKNKKMFDRTTFNSQSDDSEGILRNIWVNIEEIQKAFGMTDPTAKKVDDDNLNPPGTLERALTILLKELNNNFHDVWNFEIVVDPYDSTNLKIIDVDRSVKKPKYTKFTEGSKAVAELGIYQFPSFKNSSMVKSQNLSFKIPSSMAITTLYGSNVAGKNKVNRDSMNHTELFKLFKGDTGEEANNPFNDKYLKDLESSNIKGLVEEGEQDKIRLPNKVGSQLNDPNSKIRIGKGSLNIDASAKWWRRWLPNSNTNGDEDKKTGSGIKAKKMFMLDFEADGSPVLKYVMEDILPFPDPETGSQFTGTFSLVPSSFTRPSYFDYTKEDGPVMAVDTSYAINSHINAGSPSAQFVRDSVLPAELSLEIDGMGGLVPGDLVHTSYIQDKYKSVISVETVKTVNGKEKKVSEPHGPAFYFQIWGHTQTVSAEGWTTQLETKMRYNSIPDTGKTTYAESDAGIGESVKTKVINPKPLPEGARPRYNIPTDDEDIADDVTLDDFDLTDDDLLGESLVATKASDGLKLRVRKELEKPIAPDPQFQPVIIPIGPPPEVTGDEGTTVTGNDTDLVTTPTRLPNEQPPKKKEIEKDEPGSSAFKWSLDPNRFALGNSAEEFPLTIPATSEISALPPDIKVKKEIVVQPDIPNTTARDMYPTTVGVVPKTQIATTVVPNEAWFDSTVSYGNIEPAPDPIPSVIRPRPEIVILKSTYDGNAGGSRIAARGQTLTDKQQYGDNAYLLSHNYTLMYQLTKWNPNGDKAQIDFYGEGLPTNPNSTRGIKILQKYRQKFWDEVIEAPNETGISQFSIGTPQERLAKMRARRDEIGNTYKSLGPYDTWTPTTGIPIAMYPSYNEQEGGSDIILPTAP